MSEHIHGPSPAGSVVLNLGENIGALILEADASLLGAEIEISRADLDSGAGSGGDEHVHARRTHSMVRERHTVPNPRYDAVYPDLEAGRYTIWRDADTPDATITVVGGQITTHTFSRAAAIEGAEQS
ncbi:phospholipase [Catenulispora rubra]|uniref:phospholipase n=1 Tax=Catenulispora rubra TaxID=280293 RepID=UPI00189278BA|nr:phospholipase [Catenulispora rubra]